MSTHACGEKKGGTAQCWPSARLWRLSSCEDAIRHTTYQTNEGRKQPPCRVAHFAARSEAREQSWLWRCACSVPGLQSLSPRPSKWAVKHVVVTWTGRPRPVLVKRGQSPTGGGAVTTTCAGAACGGGRPAGYTLDAGSCTKSAAPPPPSSPLTLPSPARRRRLSNTGSCRPVSSSFARCGCLTTPCMTTLTCGGGGGQARRSTSLPAPAAPPAQAPSKTPQSCAALCRSCSVSSPACCADSRTSRTSPRSPGGWPSC